MHGLSIMIVGSRHPSVSKDNGKRLDWFSVLLGAASGVAQQPNPGVAISAAVAAGIWRCLIGILSLFSPCSYLFQLFVSLLFSPPDS